MPVINELVVKSKYSSVQNILSKTYEFNETDKIIDVIVHGERLLNIGCRVFSSYLDIKITLGIYFIYYRESSGKREPCSFLKDEEVSLRVNRKDFKPLLNDRDFSSGEFISTIRNIKAKYDIDMGCRCISIDVTANLTVNLVEEMSVVLRENKIINKAEEDEMEDFDEIPLRSVAISRNYFGGDLKNYALTLEEISKAINQKLIEIEEEKQELKKEIEGMKEDINSKNHQYLNLIEKFNNVSRDYTAQLEKLKSIENKYLKEQKRASYLEAENNKKMKEMDQLLKDRKDLISSIEKSKSTIRDRLKQLIYGK